VSPTRLNIIAKLTSPEKKRLYLKICEQSKVIDKMAEKTIAQSTIVRAEMRQVLLATDFMCNNYNAQLEDIEEAQRKAI
jgi:hypothetical protein